MRLTIKAKLIAAFAAVIILSAVSMGIALMNLGALNASFSAAMEGNVKRIQLASDLEVSTLKVARDEKNLILTQDPAAIATLVGQMDAEIDAVHTDTATLRELSSEAGKPLVDKFGADYDAYLVQHAEVRRLSTLNLDAEAFALASGKAAEVRAASVARLDEIVALNNTQLNDAIAAAEALYGSSSLLLTALLVGSTITAVSAAAVIIVGISRGLGKISQVVSAVAIGDLDQNIEIKSNDEIKDLVATVNVMTGNLRATAAIADRIADGDLTVEPKP